uniref:Uncharacterized protein n=1 Tax=Zea mays TaxID=4577 RepID=C4J7R3_MAIZE|nr:unknown [Zea mays]
MVIGEGEGEDAIGAQASSRLLESTTLRAVTFTAELLPWWWNWRREPWPTPQFKGDSSLNPADSRSNQPIEIPPLPFLLPLGSLAVRKNVDEVKSHLEYRTRSSNWHAQHLFHAAARGCCCEAEAAKEDAIPKEQENLGEAGTKIS